MHKHGKCLWSGKWFRLQSRAVWSTYIHEKCEHLGKESEHRLFKVEIRTLSWSIVLSTPYVFPPQHDVAWLVYTYSFKGETKPCVCSPDNIVQFWCSARRWRNATFCFLESKSQKESFDVCQKVLQIFLHFYLNIQLWLFPVTNGPWKLFLIRLYDSKGADPSFIGPVGSLFEKSSSKLQMQN